MKEKYLNYALCYLMLFCCWSFVCTHTSLLPNNSIYIAFLLLLVLFLKAFVSGSKLTKSSGLGLWMPYLIITCLGFFTQLVLENFTYRLVAILLLLLTVRYDFNSIQPLKILVYSGIFTIIGIFFQMLLPTLYYAYVSPLFLSYSNLVERWAESGYGFVGFNYQLSHTANILLVSEGVFLYFGKTIFSALSQKRWVFNTMSVLFIVSVMLTGKRLFSLMAILLPIIVYIISKKNTGKIIILSLFIGCFVYLGVEYFVENASRFENSQLLHRWASTVTDAKQGEDISSNRTLLADEAIRLFNENPVTGIGVGRYHKRCSLSTDAHNSYLQVLAEQGIVGFLCFIIPLIMCLIKTLNLIKYNCNIESGNYLKLSLFIQLYYILYSLSGNVFVDPGNFLIYFYAVAIMIHINSFNLVND